MARFIELHKIAWKSTYVFEKGDPVLINVDRISTVAPYRNKDVRDLNGVVIDDDRYIESYEIVKEMINE